MSATTSMPAPGETVSVSDGTVTVIDVDDTSVKYDHPEHSTYIISAESFKDYMEGH